MNRLLQLLASMVSLACVSGSVVSGSDGVDPFESLKQDLARAACCRVEFVSIVHSAVFESVDSTSGSAYIAEDGRYHLQIGRDQYLQTEDRLYSYSEFQNQLTIELSDPRMSSIEEVSFLNRLDEFYRTTTVERGKSYSLKLTDSSAMSLPDSMAVYLTTSGKSIESLEFRDINDDLNRVVILHLKALSECDSSILRPDFPDSAEVIELFQVHQR